MACPAQRVQHGPAQLNGTFFRSPLRFQEMISGACWTTAAGAADPITTLAAAPPATACDPDSGALSAESSGLDPLFRAESAANGETFVERVVEVNSGRLVSLRRFPVLPTGLPAGRGAALPAASLSNCSIGSKRCACAIFNRSQLQMKALFLPITEFAVSAQHDLQMPRQVLFRKQFGYAGHSLAVRRSKSAAGKSRPGHPATTALRRNRTICRAKCVGLCPSLISLSTSRKTVFARSLGHSLHHFFQHARRRRAHQIPHLLGSQPPGGRSNRLVENGKRITHRAVTGFGQQRQRVFVGLDIFPAGKIFELVENFLKSARREN